MNRNVTWVVSVCTTTNSTLYPIFEISDVLPPGVQFVSASNGGIYTDDGETAGVSDGAGVVTWTFDATNRPALGSNGCFTMNVTGRFPSGYVDPTTTDPANDDNVGGADKVNVASGVGRNTPTGPTTSIGVAPWTTELIGATFGIGDGGTTKRFTDLSGNDNFYVLAGEQGRFNLSGSIDSDLPADTFVITDGTNTYFSGTGANPTSSGNSMPDSFYPTSVLPGTWNAALNARLEGSDDNFVNVTVIDSTIASGDPAITLSPSFRSVRLVFDNGPDSVPGDFAVSGMQIVGTLGTPAPSDAFGLYTNTSTMSVTRGATTVTDTDFDQYILESPLPHPQITKSVANETRQPGQTTVYTINVRNDVDATGNLVDPYVEDCVPDYFTIQGSPTLGSGWATGSPLPTCAAGQTPLRFDYTGTLTPGQVSSNITYTILVDPQSPGPIAPPGLYPNTAFVRPDGGGTFGHCVNTSPSCGSTVDVQVETAIELSSQKCVTGDIDGGIFRPSPGCQTDPSGAVTAAQTYPGGLVTWELRLVNTGNVDARNVDFIDLFPRVGDTAVITETPSSSDGDTLNSRNSEFAPYLVAPITAPPGWTVSYSTSANPCRPEVGRNTSCETPTWVTNPAFLLMPTFRSVKFSFSGTLLMGATATFEWTTRAPVTDPTYDQGGTSSIDPYEFLLNCTAQTPRTDPTHCPRAVNSFAYGADAANLPNGVPQPSRFFAEPPAVEVRVTDPPKPNAIGNRVWSDVNNDGIQGSVATEPGIPNVYVELYRLDEALSTPSTPVYTFYGFTFTDALGNYLFSADPADPTQGLPDGSYKVRFVPPSQYYVSPGDQTGVAADAGAANTDDDSDVSRTPSSALTMTPLSISPSNGGSLGSFYDTVDVVLGDNNNVNVGTPSEGEIDITWDLGLWLPNPAVEVVKVTKDSAWPDNQAGDGVTIIQGRPVTWIYTVTNTGNTRLQNVTLNDDGGPDAGFSVTNCTIVSQGTNADGLTSTATAPIALNRGAVMSCTATGTASRSDYSNIATVVGTPVLDDGTTITRGSVPSTVTDTDPSSYVSGKYDLALAKTDPSLDLATGIASYTIRIRNEGTVASGDYQITDILPAGVSYIVGSASTAPSSVVGDTIVWNLTGLSVGGNRTITFQGQVNNYLVRPFRNYAEISGDSSASVQTGGVSTPTTDSDSTPDALIANDNVGNGVSGGDGYGPIGTPNATVDNANITQAGSRAYPNSGDDANDGEDDADIADLNPTLTYDLALAKVPAAAQVALGENPTFTVRVYNQGNVPSGTVTVLDQIPTGLTFTTAGSTPGCVAQSGNQVLCTLASIAVGGSTTLTLVTTINGSPVNYSTAPWRNWAEINSDSAQTLYGIDDADSQPETVEIDGIGADNTLPGDSYVGVTTADSSYATPSGTDEDDNDDAVVLGVVYDLALAKTVANFDIGTGLMDFTLTVQNQGTVPSGEYTVQDVLPAGLSVVGAATPAVTSSTGSPATGTTMTWTMPSIAAGATATITFQADIEDYRLRPFRNIAEISSDSAQLLYVINDVDSTPDVITTNDGDYGTIGSAGAIDNTSIAGAGVGADSPASGGQDDADIADVLVPVNYDLALVKTANATLVTQVSTITYSITVQNQGNVPSGDFVVTDTVPAGLAFAASATGVLVAGDPALVTFAGTNLAPGASRTYTWTATVSDVTLRPYRNVAEISDDSSAELYNVTDSDSTPDTNVDNDGDYGPRGTPSDIDGTSIADSGVRGGDPQDDADIADVDLEDLRYDLALAKTVGSPTVAYDGTITYTVTIQNQGNLDSQEIVVTDWIPAGLVVANAGGGTVSGDGTTLTWTIANIPAGESVQRTFTATVADITKRPFRNIAEITQDGADFYDIGVNGNIVDVEDFDSVPDTDRANDGTYGPVMNPGGIDNVGSNAVGSAGLGDDPEDDADIADVDIDVIYDLALVKTGPATVAPLGSVVFTVQVRNQGNVPSGPYSITDTVPEGMEIVSASDGGVFADPQLSVTWTDLPSLAPGATDSVTVTMRIVDITKRPFLNISEISADGADLYDVPVVPDGPGRPSTPAADVEDDDSIPDVVTNNDTVIDQTVLPTDRFNDPAVDEDDHDVAPLTTDVVYDLALIKTVDASSVAYNGTATFTIRIANQGTVGSGNFTVVDNLPAGTEFVSASDGGVVSNGGTVVTWTLSSLAAGATRDITVVVRPVDLTKRPFRNVAEITADSAASYSTPTETVTDADSVPGDTATSSADNTQVSEAGVGSDVGHDDEDIAVFDVPVVYDLALVKIVNPGQLYRLGGPIVYTLHIKNQGTVPSGLYSVQDVIPAGMSFISASDGGVVVAGAIFWTDLPSIAPGEVKELSLQLRLDSLLLQNYRNVAEITSDSSTTYNTPTVTVTDKDSTPDSDPSNDPIVDNDDVNVDSIPGDEDDHDIADLDLLKIIIDNRAPVVTPLPRTGGEIGSVLLAAGGLVMLGLLLVGRTRRRRPAAV
jgi:uncharacterized repeat protein (TIGR01451 family)/LPXTG-motif cell wall-anchored protein